MNERRLLKDLPFENLTAGIVISHHNSRYLIEGGTCGGSDKGNYIISENCYEILDMIWDNSLWFELSKLEKIIIEVSRDKIVINFKPLSYPQAQTFTKGVINCLKNNYGKEEQNYIWKEFNNFEIDDKKAF